MITMLRAMPALSAIAVAIALLPEPTAPRKCGTPVPPGGPFIAIDGVVVGQLEQQSKPWTDYGVAREDVYSLEILCMDPKDSTFVRGRGLPLVSIWTLSGPAPRLKDALDMVRAAQDAHYAKHGAYMKTLDNIRLPENMQRIRLTMRAVDKGWIARATVPNLLSTCSMFDGEVATALHIGPRHVVCESD